jgi:hypothetical protein
MALLFPKALLLVAAAWAIYVLWIVPYQNGLLTNLLDLQKPGSQLPGTMNVPMRRRYTGIGPLDNQIMTMIGFFMPALDGKRADISLVALEISGQAIAAWVLLVVESLRAGNKGQWVITS